MMDTESDRTLYSEYQCRICKATVAADDATGLLDDGSCEACGACYRRLTERTDNIPWLAQLEETLANADAGRYSTLDGEPKEQARYGVPYDEHPDPNPSEDGA